MDTFEAIKKRRTIRRFTGGLIPREDLEKIVDAARLAPTGSNKQPWEFVVVTDREIISKLSEGREFMNNSAAIIAVVMDTSTLWHVHDGSAAIENILLASVALGYGACWFEGSTVPFEEKFKAILNIPAEKKLQSLVPIGVPAESPNPPKRSLEDVIHWEKY